MVPAVASTPTWRVRVRAPMRSAVGRMTPRGVDVGKVVLLDAAECLGGGGVAGEDDEMATHLEEAVDRLERELVDNLEGACPVRSAGVVA